MFACSNVDGERSPRKGEKHKVIIVGAGVAGFTAAATLLENNVTDILILEASDRIGGRIHTVQFGDVPIDKGAEFVHGEVDNDVFALLSPHDLLASYEPLMEDSRFLYVNTSGGIYSFALVKKLIKKAYVILDEIENVYGSVAEHFYPRFNAYLDSIDVDPELREAILHHILQLEGVSNAAEDLAQMGAWGYSQSLENEGDLLLKWKKGGYSLLFDYISKKLPDPSEELPIRNKIALKKKVSRIERREEDVEVTCADGSRYLTDHVIVTPSLGVLKKHAATMFHPLLPAEKTAAIESLGYGDVGKVFILFPKKWWPDNISVIVPMFSKDELDNFKANSVHGIWTSSTSGFYPVMNHDRMLCAWFSGDACRIMETLPEDQVTEGLMELLEQFVGKTYDIPLPKEILRTQWSSNPYTRGAYSFRSTLSDEKHLTNDCLAEPILDKNDKPVILFAGEATHPHYFSTVHGALVSGRREAHNILNYLNIPHS